MGITASYRSYSLSIYVYRLGYNPNTGLYTIYKIITKSRRIGLQEKLYLQTYPFEVNERNNNLISTPSHGISFSGALCAMFLFSTSYNDLAVTAVFMIENSFQLL